MKTKKTNLTALPNTGKVSINSTDPSKSKVAKPTPVKKHSLSKAAASIATDKPSPSLSLRSESNEGASQAKLSDAKGAKNSKLQATKLSKEVLTDSSVAPKEQALVALEGVNQKAVKAKVGDAKSSATGDLAENSKKVFKRNAAVSSNIKKIPSVTEENVNSVVSEKSFDLPEAASQNIPKTEPKLEQNLAKKPAGSLLSPLRIFQIYYEPWQRDLLDPNFAALDNSKSNSELLEYAVFIQLSKSDYVKGAQLWGALSWRFTEKTGMTGADLVKGILSNPGYDIYYCDPFPQNEALFHNMWLHGETCHPQFLALCQAIFQVTGLPMDELTWILPSNEFSASNYYVGSQRFWNAFLPWVEAVLSAANKNLPPRVRDLMHSKLADDRDLHKGATYVPFIVERLFPIFMRTAGKDLKGYKIALPEREREMNVHLRLLREMKDVAHKTKSAWLAACWVNYRNLYLTQTNPKEWIDKHLRSITPADIKFSTKG